MTLKEISAHFNVPESYIRLLVEAGKIPYSGNGKEYEFMFDLEQVKSAVKVEQFNALSDLF